MKIEAKINLLCATESGVSKSTGNPWQSKEVVLEVADGENPSTMAVRTMNSECINKLEKCKEGDVVVADVYAHANYREFTRKDGSIGGIRSTECVLRGIEVKEEAGF